MDKVALLPARDRAALFGETGATRGVADTIIEKDFWVCWTLRRLFEQSENCEPACKIDPVAGRIGVQN
jgi:hypothetical protein